MLVYFYHTEHKYNLLDWRGKKKKTEVADETVIFRAR